MTSKKGFPWNLTLNLSVGETTVVVPEGLVVVGMSKVLEEPAQESDGVHLTFSGGKVILSYKGEAPLEVKEGSLEYQILQGSRGEGVRPSSRI